MIMSTLYEYRVLLLCNGEEPELETSENLAAVYNRECAFGTFGDYFSAEGKMRKTHGNREKKEEYMMIASK